MVRKVTDTKTYLNNLTRGGKGEEIFFVVLGGGGVAIPKFPASPGAHRHDDVEGLPLV